MEAATKLKLYDKNIFRRNIPLIIKHYVMKESNVNIQWQ